MELSPGHPGGAALQEQLLPLLLVPQGTGLAEAPGLTVAQRYKSNSSQEIMVSEQPRDAGLRVDKRYRYQSSPEILVSE